MYNVSSTSAALTVFALSFTFSKSSHKVYMNYSIYFSNLLKNTICLMALQSAPATATVLQFFVQGFFFDLLINEIILQSLQVTSSLSISFSLLPNKNTNCQGTHSPPDVPNDASCSCTHLPACQV